MSPEQRDMLPPDRIAPNGLAVYLEVMARAIFQAGMRWEVVEKRWPGIVEAFGGFEPERVSGTDEAGIEDLMADERRSRNRRKIGAVVAEAGGQGRRRAVREAARRRLMLPLAARVIYAQLGAGAINDSDSEVRLTVEALTRYEDVHVVLGESMIGGRLDISLERVHVVRDYPNAMYFPAFDASIQAGGYNSFHETRNFGLPTLFYPNMETGMDDQLARCMLADEEGGGKIVKQRNAINIETAVDDLLSRIGNIDSPTAESGAWPLARTLAERLVLEVRE